MKKVNRFKWIDTPLGLVEIEANTDGICGIRFAKDKMPEPQEAGRRGEEQCDSNQDAGPETEGREQTQKILEEAGRQLTEYMEGRRKEFDLPLNVEGTPFQKRVWEELCRIPYGETRTYGQIAALAGNPKGSRAVGMANHHNPVCIVIPCHRVIGAGGKLTGYAGGMDKKEGLLRLERENT